jgi:hypothetical protein
LPRIDPPDCAGLTEFMMTFDQWVRHLGLGFHPDNMGQDYSPALSPHEIADYDAAMAEAFASGRDPYERALEIWREMDLIT